MFIRVYSNFNNYGIITTAFLDSNSFTMADDSQLYQTQCVPYGCA